MVVAKINIPRRPRYDLGREGAEARPGGPLWREERERSEDWGGWLFWAGIGVVLILAWVWRRRAIMRHGQCK